MKITEKVSIRLAMSYVRKQFGRKIAAVTIVILLFFGYLTEIPSWAADLLA